MKEEIKKKLHKTVPGLFRIRSLNDTNIKSLAEHSTSFSMVRHPFERLETSGPLVFKKNNKIHNSRLVSAFQNKFVDQNSGQIINTYGKLNFLTFVHMVIKTSKKNCRSLNKCNLNVHWQPFISRCGYCDIPYKVIAKAENFAEDQKFIGKLANIDFKPFGM